MNQPLNNRTAGVIDPILSTHARGYRNGELISDALFPRVPIPNRSMRVIAFGKESFRLVNTRRAPGADMAVLQYGYASDPVSLNQEALAALVPVEHQEEAASIPGIDLSSNAINMVMDVIDLGLEVECANLARNAASYDSNHKLVLTGTDRWTDDTSDPQSDMDAAREAIRSYIGRYPNTLELGATAFNALCRHPKIREQFKYTSSDSITEAMLARYFKVDKVVVGKAVYLPDTAGDDDAATDVWGNDAILAYVPTAGENYMRPAYGYTYELMGYPQVEKGEYQTLRRSWVHPMTVERRPYITGIVGGFLFQNAGAA
ncbi:major capsid protein [Oceaniglobus trochenteri]|uniref:major capsid protein n=1 Tax=Oceaniglobus trochenteri TaxID=2763260 RepID=UPI001CFF8C01|nr:major capsid protein [Oceaniglobus trochenteri]